MKSSKTNFSRKGARQWRGDKKTVQTAGVLRQIPVDVHCMHEEVIAIKFSKITGEYFSLTSRLAGNLNSRI
jgi:hypothetical protein